MKRRRFVTLVPVALVSSGCLADSGSDGTDSPTASGDPTDSPERASGSGPSTTSTDATDSPGGTSEYTGTSTIPPYNGELETDLIVHNASSGPVSVTVEISASTGDDSRTLTTDLERGEETKYDDLPILDSGYTVRVECGDVVAEDDRGGIQGALVVEIRDDGVRFFEIVK